VVITVNKRLLKKADIDQRGLWVRPVRFEPGFDHETTSLNNPADSDGTAPAPTDLQGESAQTARIRNLLHDLTTQLAHDKERLLDELYPHIVQLAITIARRIVAAEIRQDRRVVERTVKAALEDLACHGELHVRVHPDDRPVVQDILQTDETLLGRLSNLRVIGDSSIERGGCIVESDYEIIDADIPTQLAQIHRSLPASVKQ